MLYQTCSISAITIYLFKAVKLGMIIFVQSFPAGEAGGGGGRILRRLTEGSKDKIRFICTSETIPKSLLPNEVWIPTRPGLGRLDRSRFRWVAGCVENLTSNSFQRRLLEYLKQENASAVHVLPHHNMDYMAAAKVAAQLKLPLYCTVHDDTRYVNRGRKDRGKLEQGVQMVWHQAAARFVICPEIGEEYNRRYGQQSWQVITDGLDVAELESIEVHPPSGRGEIRPYFMGLFHNGYRESLSSFLKAADVLRKKSLPFANSMRLRCGALSRLAYEGDTRLDVLPFGPQEEVKRDMEHASLLYLPLPFGDAYKDFVKYSFSTKLISYLGAGRLIFYHGPEDAALASYLKGTNAAICAHSLDPVEIAEALSRHLGDAAACLKLIESARMAARTDFDFYQIKSRFWDSITRPQHHASSGE